MGDRNLDRHEAKKILKKSPNYEEAYSFWKNSDWRRLAIRLEKHLEQARAFKTLVEELVKIRDFVSTLSPNVSKEEALKLKAILNESNFNIERSLKGWINVDKAMVSFIDEVMSTLGLASGGINSILLLFMSLFQEALERDDLYLVRIELERTDNDKRDVIPVS